MENYRNYNNCMDLFFNKFSIMKKKKLLKEVERLNLKLETNFLEIKKLKNEHLNEKLELVRKTLLSISDFEESIEIIRDDFYPEIILEKTITFKVIL